MPEFDATLEFRNIPDRPGYKIGTDGTAWSCWTRSGQSDKWRQLKARKRHGYLMVSLWNPSRQEAFIRRLLLLAFKGPCPPGMEACHNDGVKNNNALSNLRWDTRIANMADRVAHGTSNRGERNGQSTLSADTVRAIRDEYAAGGTSYSKLAHKFGTGWTAVCKVVKRRRWRHV